MKKTLKVLLVTLLVCPAIHGQVQPYIQEQSISLEDGVFTAWDFPLPGELEEAFDDLNDYCKEKSEIRMRKASDNLLIAEKVSIPNVASKRGDLIAYGYTNPTYNAMAIAFKLGYDISLNSADWPLEMRNLRVYVKAFMAWHYNLFYSKRIEVLEKELKSLDKELNNMEKEVEGIEKRLENNELKLEKMTDEVRINAIKNDNTTLQSDKERIVNALPDLRTNIDKLKENLDNLKKESQQLQVAIGSL